MTRSEDEQDRTDRSEARRETMEWLRANYGDQGAQAVVPCFQRVFGGGADWCMNFMVFMRMTGFCGYQATYRCPPGGKNRARLVAMAAGGALLRGADIPILTLLEPLPIAEVRQIALALGIGKSKSKRELMLRIYTRDRAAVDAAMEQVGRPAADYFRADPDRLLDLCR